MPISLKCEVCCLTFTRPKSQIKARVFCSKACAYKGLTKTEISARRMVYKPSHPLAGINGYLPEHRILLYQKIGPGDHQCNWCKTNIKWMPKSGCVKGCIVVDHVDGNKFNNDPSNLVPSCQGCNTWRQRQDELIRPDEDFIPHGPNGKWKLRAEKRNCLTCRSEFLFSPSKERKPNGGKYCSLKCLHNRHKIFSPP